MAGKFATLSPSVQEEKPKKKKKDVIMRKDVPMAQGIVSTSYQWLFVLQAAQLTCETVLHTKTPRQTIIRDESGRRDSLVSQGGASNRSHGRSTVYMT